MSNIIKTGVIGHPISHSKSPLIHNHWIKKYGLSGEYLPIDIPCDDLKSRIEDLKNESYAGFNVTIPHKESIHELCDEIDETAAKIGAVNTVIIKDGKLLGRNTDAFGFIENIKQSAPNFSLKDKTAFVLGAGGAAKAVIYGLQQQGIKKIFICNRTRAKAENLLQHFTNLEVIDWCSNSDDYKASLSESNLLINTTALGMNGQPELPIDLKSLNKDALVSDIVYAPLITPLLESAQARGNKIITGIGMLLHQARPAFEAWYGVMPEVDEELQQKALA
ncbi:shikimate dehydrogenase [Alphaproteobacteria bacterium]|nr:shikimate dehydrogenase [Alphaproteobacteria bacterium]